MELRLPLVIFLVTLNSVLSNFDGTEIPETESRIVGGTSIIDDEFPFMAVFGWQNNVTNEVDYHAGGMLISSKFVLTAAHCVFLKGKLPNVIIIGGNNLNGIFNEKHEVNNFFIFPNHDDRLAYYDIALFEMKTSSGRPQVCLWTEPTLTTRNVTAIGYGLTQFAGTESKSLLKVNLVEFPEEECKPFFKRQRKFRSGIMHSHLCAGDPERKKDTCQGDSGGPLLVNYQGQIYAAGITSTGQACSGFPPAVYTRISSYIDWIEEIVKAHGQSIRKTCNAPTEEHYADFTYEE